MKPKNKIMVVLWLLCASCSPLSAPEISEHTETPIPTPKIARPFPQHIPYKGGGILPNHRPQSRLDADVRAYYDYWKSNYIVSAGTKNGKPLYRVAFGKYDPNKQTTVSEGQGYGMLILPVMAGHDPKAQNIFDGLWLFAHEHPSEIDPRLMDWNTTENQGNASAFDGDADIALGLLLADAQWGSNGAINYKAEAMNIIAAIQESTIGKDSRLPMLGDWVNAGEARFNQYTPRSSDFMLANFRAFQTATQDPLWNETVRESQKAALAIQQKYSPNTGLLPDFIILDNNSYTPAPPNFLEKETDGAYYYNAGRIPWRIGTDSLLYNDQTSREIVQKISRWIETETDGNPGQIKAGYELNGAPLSGSGYFTTFFVAPFGVAAMNEPAQQEWLNAIYDLTHNAQADYYEDTINLLCLITMTGNFWAP